MVVLSRDAFYTGLVCPASELRANASFVPRGWHFTYSGQQRRDLPINGDEVMIHASQWSTAQKALDLILGGLCVLHGDPPPLANKLIAWNDSEPEFGHLFATLKDRAYSTTGIPRACDLAAKASRDARYVYAIAKYYFSISRFAVEGMDLDPSNIVNLRISQTPDDHILFAYSIISAYSVLEDLGLEIRSTKENPSRVNGKWNPAVKEELEARLVKAKINISEPIFWIMRGTRRRTEKAMPLPVFSRLEWARGPVRDADIRLLDAIAYSSWLRSKVASHRTRDLARSLSPYDVVNVQALARRLILECLGFWSVE